MPESRDWRKWAARAEQDWQLAQLGVEKVPAAASYNLHQAVEKYLKAVIWRRGGLPPRTHDLEELLELIDSNLDESGREYGAAELLTQIMAPTRYPEEVDEPTVEEALALAEAARTLRRYAREKLGLEDTDA